MVQSLPKVEVFQAGDHKGGPWTEAHLHAMCRNAAILRNVLTPPLVIGHGDDNATAFGEEGEPSFGQAPTFSVEYRVPEGETEPRATLLADLSEVPDSLAYLIHSGAYRTISPEIYQTLPKSLEGKVTGPVIKRIAVLGGSIPEVKTLQDVTDIYRKQSPSIAFSDARPARQLTFTKAVINDATGTVVAFSDLPQPASKVTMFTKKPLAKCSDAVKAVVKKFDDAPATMGREDYLAILADAGYDTSSITDAVPDSFLAECARMARLFLEGDAQDKAEEGNDAAAGNDTAGAGSDTVAAMGDVTMTPNGNDTITVDDKKKKDDSTVAMSDKADIAAIVNAAVTEAVAKFSDEIKVTRKQLAAESRDARKLAVTMFCDDLCRQGKVFPAEIDGGLVDVLLAQDDAAAIKFSDGTEATAFAKMKSQLASRPQLVKFSESVKNKQTSTVDDEATVLTFAEGIKDSLAKNGRKPAFMVETFKAAKQSNPDLTATEFIQGQTA